jgi:hypothetical protein
MNDGGKNEVRMMTVMSGLECKSSINCQTTTMIQE